MDLLLMEALHLITCTTIGLNMFSVNKLALLNAITGITTTATIFYLLALNLSRKTTPLATKYGLSRQVVSGDRFSYIEM